MEKHEKNENDWWSSNWLTLHILIWIALGLVALFRKLFF
jgi:hypothetical protein